jgi:multiple sugar transport system permease protein
MTAIAPARVVRPDARPRGRSSRRGSPTSRWVAWLIAVVAAVVAAFPLVVIVLTAFKPTSEALQYPPKLIPSDWTLSNFPDVFQRIPVWDQLVNTIAMSVGVTVLSLFFDSLAAYALSRIEFRGRTLMLTVLIATLMIPFQTLLVPLYKMLSDFGWIGSLTGLIVPRAADVAGIFLLRQFFISIPRDLDSAGRIDGASEFRIYWQIILPNATAGLLTLGLFNFIGNWNDLLWPMVMTNEASDRTLTAGLALLNGSSQGVVPYGVTMAGSLISVLPLIIIFAIVQRRFIESVAMSGIKG